MNVQRGDSELRCKCPAVINPGFQRGGTIDVSMLDEHLADLRAAQPVDLPGSYLRERNRSTFAQGRAGLIRVVKHHSLYPFSSFSRHLMGTSWLVNLLGPICARIPSKSRRLHATPHRRTNAVSRRTIRMPEIHRLPAIRSTNFVKAPSVSLPTISPPSIQPIAQEIVTR
jgi:hypothetical protein